jgi:hypothetical protein
VLKWKVASNARRDLPPTMHIRSTTVYLLPDDAGIHKGYRDRWLTGPANIRNETPVIAKLRNRIRRVADHLQIGPNLEARLASVDQQLQKQLLQTFQRRCAEDPALFARGFNDYGFRVYSQYEEDGLLLYIFAAVGFGSKRVVEICAGDGRECMATNLIINHQFDGLLFDGNDKRVTAGRQFFASHKDTFWRPPSFQRAWITVENVNALLVEQGFQGEIDLLSLDLDGIDYWIWKALDVVRPRVCVFETNNIIPSSLSLTVPYSDEFDSSWDKPDPEREFRSVSLRALTKLSQKKGYRLIGAHRHGFNVFFIREDLATNIFPTITVDQVHDNPSTRQAQLKWERLKDLPWQVV